MTAPLAPSGCYFSEALQDSSDDVAEPLKVILKSRYRQLAEIYWHHDGGSHEAVRESQAYAALPIIAKIGRKASTWSKRRGTPKSCSNSKERAKLGDLLWR